jgi:small subunit ribosomal protein S8
MSQTDPIAELLTRIRNASRARYNQVAINHSRLREAICRVLLSEGFLSGVETAGEGPKKKLVLGLRYSQSREPVIRGVKRVSRPSLRRYAGVAEIPKARGSMGVHVVSTPLGVMTDREARRKRVGGEILLRVW